MDRARQTDLLTRPAATSRRGKRATASARPIPNPSRRAERCTALSFAIAGNEPPTEFRIFSAGQVETTKGVFTFDAAAAERVMAEYAAHGIDLMIDYDHASLAQVTLDPAQTGKAAGWFQLEVRTGELWAVNVRWTEPAAAQLRAKEWRFMSPAFATDDEAGISSLLNVAITNLPATRRLDPLMAASVIALGESGMDPKLISAALDALIAGDAEKCMDLLKGVIASAAGAEASEPADADPANPDATTPPDVAAAGGTDVKPPMVPPPAEKKAAVAASIARMMHLSDAKSFTELLSKFESYRASHIELETERTALATERKVLESAERRKGCADLVTLAGRGPATVWSDDSATAPKSYLASMPIADFRSMVADAIKANGKPSATPKPAVDPSAAPGANGLTASELAACAKSGCTPEAFIALKTQRDSVRT